MGCLAVDKAVPPLIRGQVFGFGYEENSVRNAATLMGLATHYPN